MPCWHGWGDCCRWPGPPDEPGWYGRAGVDVEPGWSGRRRRRRGRRTDLTEAVEELSVRIDELREQLRLTEAELADLRDRERAAGGS